LKGRLAGKIGVVTGGSKGIGAGIAKTLALEGARVIVNYRSDREDAERVVAEIKAEGGDAFAVQADVTKREDVTSLFQRAAERFGNPDVLVNNAGMFEFRSLDEIDEDHFRRVFDVNVLGLLLCTREAARRMNRGAAIVNIGSVTSKVAVLNHAVYSGSKAAVDIITPILAHELGPRGIRINTVSPGMVPTEGLTRLGLPGSPFQEWVEKRTPLGRIGTPQDIASAVIFLSSDEASWITGEVLTVAGGTRTGI
jgi:3-oxoacyl-[acyl-carrier protein] reductase